MASRSQPVLAPNGQPKVAGTVAPAVYPYRGWWITYDPPPIPMRNCDWAFWHDDFDASWEGEEDGWVSNGLCGTAESMEAAKAEIDEREDGE